MNKSGQFENDILRNYITPERIEKAPERLTGKIMTRIHVERAPLRTIRRFRLIFSVPLVSIIITLALIILAIVFSSTSDNKTISVIAKYISNLSFSVPEFKLDSIPVFSPSSVAIYIAIGFFILIIFDRALNRLFHGQRK